MADLEAKVLLEPVPSTSGRVAPFALYLPSGFSPSKETSCQWELQASNTSDAHHYVIGRMPAVDMVGHTQAVASGPPACRYALGVLDKASGTLKYIEVQAGQVMRVEPRARSISYEASDAGASQVALDREKSIAQNRRLVDAFGSTRRKRQLKNRDGAQVQADAVGGTEAVRSLLQSVGDKAVAAGATKAEVMEKAMGYRVLPPHNPNATAPQEAYNLEGIIPKELWAALETESLQEVVQRKSKDDDSEMPEFVQHCLMSIHDPKSSDGKRSLKGAAYLVASMKLYNGPSSIRADPMKGGIAAAAEKFDLQVEVLQSFLDDFYDLSEQDGMSSYSRSEQKKTLQLMYILVVGLVLEGYQMGPRQCDKLRQGLKAQPSLFFSLYRELGCIVKSTASKKSGLTSSPARDMSIVLLPPTEPPKKLADYFPGIKLGSKRAKK